MKRDGQHVPRRVVQLARGDELSEERRVSRRRIEGPGEIVVLQDPLGQSKNIPRLELCLLILPVLVVET